MRSDPWSVRTKARVPRVMHVVPGESSPVPPGVRGVPEDKTYLEIFEDERALLDNPPTVREIEDFFHDRLFRYLMVRLAIAHNVAADRMLYCELPAVPDVRGRVMGYREALSLPALLLDEARTREGRDAEEKEDEDRPPVEYDDFGARVGLAPQGGQE